MLTAHCKRGPLQGLRAVLMLALALCFGAGVAGAATQLPVSNGVGPIIDGNGDDLIAFASSIGATGCAQDLVDSRDDIVIADPQIIVCGTLEDTTVPPDGVNDYFINGFDVRRFVLVYDRPNKNLYLLFRVEGIIGDVDGNGKPDDSQCPPAVTSFPDQPGIGSQENYQLRLDTDCDGQNPEIEIEVGGVGTDQITVVGATTGVNSMAYRPGNVPGHDLEVLITNIDLPPVFRLSANANASFDGLGEDITSTETCGAPVPSIDLTKSVSVPVLCPGASADFTMVVTNTGNVDLADITLVDNLPAGLTYTSTVSNTCGGAVNAVGGQITYGPFGLATGASCTIVMRVGRTAGCTGEQTNNASVDGYFTSPCVNGGDPTLVSDNASASILCGNVTCSIDAPDTRVCTGETVQICGPIGDYTYLWNTGATTRCITVGAGTYSLVITEVASGCVSTNPCEVTITTEPCVENCPRTVGFWGAQCALRDNGSQKFTLSQLTQIAECIDSRSAFFNWAQGTDFDMFCRALSTSNMTVRVQAKRQFAGVLANMCTDFLNLQPSRGGEIYLDPGTPIRCSGLMATNLGDLIEEVDAILAELEGMSLNDPMVKSRYGDLISCLDGINNGMNIPVSEDCEHGGTMPMGDEFSSEGGGSVELYRPIPNPFTGTTAFAYKVDATDATVDITVYDVAGRQIRKLVSGVQGAGQYTVSWDGRNDAGVQATRGVYFVRTIIAGAKASTNRVLYLSE